MFFFYSVSFLMILEKIYLCVLVQTYILTVPLGMYLTIDMKIRIWIKNTVCWLVMFCLVMTYQVWGS